MTWTSPKAIPIGVWIVVVTVVAIFTTGYLPVLIIAIPLAILFYLLYAGGVRLHKKISEPNKSGGTTNVEFQEGYDE